MKVFSVDFHVVCCVRYAWYLAHYHPTGFDSHTLAPTYCFNSDPIDGSIGT